MTDGVFDAAVSLAVDTGDRITVRRRYGRLDEYVVARSDVRTNDVRLDRFTAPGTNPSEAVRRIETAINAALKPLYETVTEATAAQPMPPSTQAYEGSMLQRLDDAMAQVDRARIAFYDALGGIVRPLQAEHRTVAVEYRG